MHQRGGSPERHPGRETRDRSAPEQLDDADIAGPLPRRRPFQGRGERRPLRQLCARDLMTTTIICASPGASLLTVADLMRRYDVGVVPVLDPERRLQGMITDRDLVVRALADGMNLAATQAAEVMSREVAWADVDAPAGDLVEQMERQQVRRLPVVDEDERLVGIVSVDDIALRADDDEALQELLARTAARQSFWQDEAWR